MRLFKRAMEPSASEWRLARPVGGKAHERLLSAFNVIAISDGFGGLDHNTGLHIVDRQCKLMRVLDSQDVEGAVSLVRRLGAAT